MAKRKLTLEEMKAVLHEVSARFPDDCITVHDETDEHGLPRIKRETLTPWQEPNDPATKKT